MSPGDGIDPIDDVRARALGFDFPGGQLFVPEHQRFLSHAAARTSLDGDVLHPMWVMIGGLRAMGVTIQDLMTLMGASADDGVVFGEAKIEQAEALRANCVYHVGGRCTDVQRRTGGRIGTFDILTFELAVAREGNDVALSTNSFIFPRGLQHED